MVEMPVSEEGKANEVVEDSEEKEDNENEQQRNRIYR
jgi:hypothetical protein